MLILFWICVNLVSIEWAAHAAGSSKFVPEQPLLSTVMEGHLTGLDNEEDEDYQRLKKQTLEYLKIRNLKYAHPQKKALLRSCKGNSDITNPYCYVLLQEEGLKQGHSVHALKQKWLSFKKMGLRNLLWSPDLGKVPESVLSFGMGHLRDVGLLKKLSEYALESQTCLSSRALAHLGFRVEKEFPDPAYQELAKTLYGRAMSCGQDAYAVKSGYRLGLILIWQKKYSEADTVFSKIMDQKEADDYDSRILYWRYFCATQLKNTDLQSKMKTRLIKEHPLGFHTLFVSQPEEVMPDVSSSRVIFRSVKTPSLNSAVAAAELLQAMHEDRPSVEVLSSISSRLKEAEPELQLYVAALLVRAKDFLNRSPLLLSLFKDHPSLISKETLSFLYPLEKMKIIRSTQAILDPYLVISLIRQESAFNERAKSRAGAMGLMQLMPRTARSMEHGSKGKLFDPNVNIRVGVKFFSLLINRFNGDIELALAAYNAGADRAEEWSQRYGSAQDNRLLFLDLIPFKETREYVAAIVRNYYWYTRLYPNEIFHTEGIPSKHVPLMESLSQIVPVPANRSIAEKLPDRG